MKLELEVYDVLCSTSTFRINGIEAESSDFGVQGDRDSENAEEYGCGDMHFDPQLATQEVLDKYKITQAEYDVIATQLEDKLSFGACGWCV